MLKVYTLDENVDIPSKADSSLYSMLLTKQTGIFNKFGKCDVTAPIDYSVTGFAKIKFNKGMIAICGRIVEVEQDTELSVPLTATQTGSIGVVIDLSKAVGQQAEFYTKTTQTLTQQDLNDNLTGKYEFEIFKYTSTGATIVLSKQQNLIEPFGNLLETDGKTIKTATNIKPDNLNLLVLENKYINSKYDRKNLLSSPVVLLTGQEKTVLTHSSSLENARLRVLITVDYLSGERVDSHSCYNFEFILLSRDGGGVPVLNTRQYMYSNSDITNTNIPHYINFKMKSATEKNILVASVDTFSSSYRIKIERVELLA